MQMISSEDFSTRLQKLVDSKKITQAKVAEGCGVTRAQVNKWLSGKVGSPRRITLVKIADFFHCDLEWLASGKGNPFPHASTQPSLTTQEPELSYQTREPEHQEHGKESQGQLSRLVYLQSCPGWFKELFTFVGDEYGEDEEAVKRFFKDLDKHHPIYKHWKENKKDKTR